MQTQKGDEKYAFFPPNDHRFSHRNGRFYRPQQYRSNPVEHHGVPLVRMAPLLCHDICLLLRHHRQTERRQHLSYCRDLCPDPIFQLPVLPPLCLPPCQHTDHRHIRSIDASIGNLRTQYKTKTQKKHLSELNRCFWVIIHFFPHHSPISADIQCVSRALLCLFRPERRTPQVPLL